MTWKKSKRCGHSFVSECGRLVCGSCKEEAVKRVNGKRAVRAMCKAREEIIEAHKWAAFNGRMILAPNYEEEGA